MSTVTDVLDLYHRTTPEAAAAIMRERRMTSKEWDGSLYFSTARTGGQADGYGATIVHVRVPADVAELDDEFPDGEQHYRVKARDLRPEWFVSSYES